MAKVKIIKSGSLECLESRLLQKIDEANIQGQVYKEELEKQQRSKQNESILFGKRAQMRAWLDRSQILHECLYDIKMFESEIEI